MGDAIRVLIVDDSALARDLLRCYFEEAGGFEVIGEAQNGREAVEMARLFRPQLVTMDLEMPVMGGLEAIEEIMSTKALPILVVSGVADAQNAYAAVAKGALDVVGKPGLELAEQEEFIAKARMIATIPVITHVRAFRRPSSPGGPAAQRPLRPVSAVVPADRMAGGRVFVIASSTGGPQALAAILAHLPAGFSCPVVIAQHISDGFAGGMADWLNTVTPLSVRLGRQGDPLMPGQVLVSPSESHLAISPDRRLNLLERRTTDIYRPSCDHLLESAAAVYGRQCVGIILTGMGSDGARGMEAIQRAGGLTIAQDEASSVIFGMNRVAIERGAAARVLSLDVISEAMQCLARGAA